MRQSFKKSDPGSYLGKCGYLGHNNLQIFWLNFVEYKTQFKANEGNTTIEIDFMGNFNLVNYFLKLDYPEWYHK